jgi:Ferritin-like domain
MTQPARSELSRRDLAAWTLAGGGLGALTVGALPALAATSPPSVADVLNAALTLELLAVFAYERVLGYPQLSAAATRTVGEFLVHEQRHVQVLSDELAKLGLPSPPGPPSAAVADAQLAAHGGSGSFSALRSQRDCLKILQEVESVLEGGYYLAVAKVGQPALIRTMAAIMAVEAQHSTALTGLQHPGEVERAVPYAFVEGKH